jgi:hypothetical protein
MIWIWLTAAAAYAAFYFWYNGLRRPLAPREVDDYMARLRASAVEISPQRLETMRAFLASDDGGEFYMVNLVRLHAGAVRGPGEETARPAANVLDDYTRRFLPALLRRGGHPVLLVSRAGGYVEHWGVEDDPEWSFAGVVRYRSRRDMMELVIDPRFSAAHLFKTAAIERTFAFPARLRLFTFGPRLFVAVVIALLAALLQIVVS